jgi:phosphoribosyl 1,2-cyclic phosphodiesterase
MKVSILASGSAANALVVEVGDTRLLVDCGLGPRTLAVRMRALGIAPESITGVAITHEHSDHIHGLGACCRKWRWPVFTSGGTHAALAELGATSVHEADARRVVLSSGSAVSLGDIELTGVRILHDAAEPMAFVVACRVTGARLAVATDIGAVTPAVLAAFERVDALVLESNHCTELLATGPYPVFLKRRILARTGHLSNAECAQTLATLVHPGLSHVVLAHLSEVNNTPDVARGAAGDALRKAGWRGRLAIAGAGGLASGFEVGASGAVFAPPVQLSLM